MKKRPHPNHDGKERDRRTRRLTTALWFCLFALFAAASSESEEEKKAPEEVEGAGWFGDSDAVVENPGKGGTGPAESAPSEPAANSPVERETLARQIDAAIEATKNELKAIEEEGLGDKEAQAVMAELKAEVEGELAKLVKSKRFLEAPDQKAVEDLINQLPFPGSDSSAPPAQPKPVAANPGGVAASGNAFNRKLTDLLIQPIPEKESYAENLEALRVRVEAIEAEVFKGVVEAAKSADPVGELSQARADLGEAVKLLQSKNGHEPGRCAAKLRESIGARRKELESKVVATGQTVKDRHMNKLNGIEVAMEKLDGIDKDLSALSSLTESLEGELKEIMELYVDTKSFDGETAAKTELLEILTEKEKEWFPDRAEELSPTDNSKINPDATKPSAGTNRRPPGYPASGARETPKIASIRIHGWNDGLQAHPVYFYSGSSVIGDSQQREPVKAMAPIVKEAVEAGCRVEIRGFSDASGNASRNKEIAEARSNAVGNELRKLGAANSWSASAEIDASASGADRKGRRVEVSVAAP